MTSVTLRQTSTNIYTPMWERVKCLGPVVGLDPVMEIRPRCGNRLRCESYIQISPRKKLFFFSRFAAVYPLREIIFFAEKSKNHLFRRGFSPRNFVKKLRESSRRNSVRFRGDTPRDFAETLREILRWVGKYVRFHHADSEDSDQTEKLSECPA